MLRLMPTTPMTSAQASYLRALAAKNAVWGRAMSRDETIANMEQILALGLGQDEASKLLTQASAAPRFLPSEIPATPREIEAMRKAATDRALFGLTLSVAETVAKVEEIIALPEFSKSQARELISLSYRTPPHPTAQTPLRLSDIEGVEGLNITEGHYAVFDADEVLRFYRIYTPTSGANRGEGVIRRVAGDNLMGLYPSEAATALRKINAAPDDAAFRFSDTFTRCWICGKNLTDSVSRLLSMGPTCRGFANHGGLKSSAAEVDHNPQRRNVYRAIRQWALAQGFVDPRTKEDRTGIQMSASRVASAWSGIPGIIALEPAEALKVVDAALREGDLSVETVEAINTAPRDTLLILIESRVLSAPIIETLVTHTDPVVVGSANDYFLSLLDI
jgi:hypothetical protein